MTKKVKTRKPTQFRNLLPGHMFVVWDHSKNEFGPTVYLKTTAPNVKRGLLTSAMERGTLLVTKIGADGFTIDAMDFCNADAKVLRVIPGSKEFGELLDKYHRTKHSNGTPLHGARPATRPMPVAVGKARNVPPTSVIDHSMRTASYSSDRLPSDRPAATVEVRSESVHLNAILPRNVFDHAKAIGGVLVLVVPVK